MAKAKGRFTVVYRPTNDKQRDEYGDKLGDEYKHGIIASSRSGLRRQAERHCPKDYSIKSILWQCGRGTVGMWFMIEGKTFAKCWDEKECKLAFGE